MADTATDVTPKRILAWLIDLAVQVAIPAIVAAPLGRSGTFPDATQAASHCDAQSAANAGVACLRVGKTVLEWDNNIVGLVGLVALLVALLNNIVLQGTTGASLGKHLIGLRVVDEVDRSIAGVKACIIRSFLWIIDGIPGIPIVGGVLMLLSDKSQRLGDRAAKTLVIDASYLDGAPHLEGSENSGLDFLQPAPFDKHFSASRDADEQVDDTGWVEPTTTMPTIAAEGPPITPAPTITEPASPWDQPTEAIPVQAEREPAPGAPQPIPEAQPEPADAVVTEPEPRPGIDAPMWDEARGTHIQWDPKLQMWMGWDLTESCWKPL